MDDYTCDEPIGFVCSVKDKGYGHDRDEVTAAVAGHLGFSQITDGVRDPIKSPINAGIRRGVLGCGGARIWRTA